MIAHVPHKSHSRHGTPVGIFPWRKVRRPLLHYTLPFVITSCAFLFLIGSVDIRVASPVPRVDDKASIIRADNHSEIGRSLAALARQGGPFPSRFDVRTWPGRAAYETKLKEPQWTPLPYHTTLLDLPQEQTTIHLPPLATKGQPVLPTHSIPKVETHSPVLPTDAPQPALRPLSGITMAAIPEHLPALDLAEIPAAPRPYLLRLAPSGSVLDVLPLDTTRHPASVPIAAWLRTITFTQPDGKPSTWAAVEVEFSNAKP